MGHQRVFWLTVLISFFARLGISAPGIALFPDENPTRGVATAILPDRSSLLLVRTSREVQGMDYPEVSVTKFLPNGKSDQSFGKKGIADAGFAGRFKGILSESIALARDGSFIVAGGIDIAEREYRLFLAKFKSDGSLDPAFGNKGLLIDTLPA